MLSFIHVTNLKQKILNGNSTQENLFHVKIRQLLWAMNIKLEENVSKRYLEMKK